MASRHIFRMTHFRNIEQFCLDGAIYSGNYTPRQKCFRTSYRDIVHRRSDSRLQPPCGSSTNDFVPFYFSPITAMAGAINVEYVRLISPDNRDVGTAAMDDIVFIISNTNKIQNADLEFWYTDIACNSFAKPPVFENDLSRIETHIDWGLFDETPIIAKIPEIGYDGVCKWFKDFDEPLRYKNRRG